MAVKPCPKCNRPNDADADLCAWCAAPMDGTEAELEVPAYNPPTHEDMVRQLNALKRIDQLLYWIVWILGLILLATAAGAYIVYHYSENPY